MGLARKIRPAYAKTSLKDLLAPPAQRVLSSSMGCANKNVATATVSVFTPKRAF
uniref:Uncharacterized protein n=1 Tax=Spironucleus salmonicida TaxID=348837 RepID=V6LJI3_9EUKA|eukprot:EST44750.1 Hypothetical protein SS50377_15372 [Spironucleus salmonicida]